MDSWKAIALGSTLAALALGTIPRLADPAPRRDAMGETGSMAVAVGSTEPGRNDLFVVLYKRPTGLAEPADRITMAVYKNMSGDVRQPRLQLRSARELTYDLSITELAVENGRDGPSVKELKDAFEKRK